MAFDRGLKHVELPKTPTTASFNYPVHKSHSESTISSFHEPKEILMLSGGGIELWLCGI